MAKLILVSALCFCLIIEGAAVGSAAAGAACPNGDECVATATCESSVCKIKAAGDCTTSTDQCLAHATCTNNACVCDNGFTADTDNTVCGANVGGTCSATAPCVSTAFCDTTCKLKIGQTCTPGETANCIADAECPTSGTTANKCTCKNGVTPSEDKTKCGAVGVAASMLLIVATYLTSLCL